jgi:hypothetical protein
MFLGLLKKMNLAIEEDEFGSCLKLSLAVGGGSGDLFWEGFVVRELRVLRYHYIVNNCIFILDPFVFYMFPKQINNIDSRW